MSVPSAYCDERMLSAPFCWLTPVRKALHEPSERRITQQAHTFKKRMFLTFHANNLIYLSSPFLLATCAFQ